MSGEPPTYPPSNRTNSTSDDMTLTNPTNPSTSVAPSTTHLHLDSHDKPAAAATSTPNTNTNNITSNTTEKANTVGSDLPKKSITIEDSRDLTGTTTNEKLQPITSPVAASSNESPRDAHTGANTNAEDNESIAGISQRRTSILRPPLPPLPFHLRDHKGPVAFAFAVMVIDHGFFPPAAYFGLKYATNISLTVIFGIITGIFGVVLGIECLVRSIKLILKSPRFRPLGQTARFGMDFWQFSLTVCLIINVVCVSVGTALDPPFLNLMAMPMPTLIFNMSWQLLLSDFLHERKYRTPFRISSTPKGEIWPRFIYVIIEDVIAVDCNGKRDWRQSWKDRVEASKPMRETLKRLSMFWGIGGIMISTLCFGLLWGFDSVSGKEAGYALGWLLPWAWIIPSSIFTTFYVKKRLKDERHFCQRYKGSFSA
ncbi:hypothetical protein TWF106_009537 [Orbilia oligospora]|uniref:Uncharacterized protein n=1 Tax=Orbilia oligospora TaxID=2813651 RepID=A0A6G1MJF4_ORBOL|nr:hypothetical protein TWF679_005383 [Orbilia oligospora]KAF3213410.1 hypothetical protein TWF106_009537 [Orbilia oligospora]KAF3229953.1 hypothetical protein TWF191_000856 [Orbilia oligospora]KAF3260591.1 hypothetical protein TWF192_009872 [Orbilia oligospora]